MQIAINQLKLKIMFKTTFASLLMFTMVLSFSVNVNAQESDDYSMWESIMLTPDYTKLKILQTNMRKHNQTFHKEGTNRATVYNISTGPNAGKLLWQMGPMMFKHNDTRPDQGAHADDWRDNIMPYIKEIHTTEYWKQDDKLSNVGMLTGDDETYPILFVRFFEVDEDHGYSMNSLFKQVSETLKSMPGENPWGVYYNEFLQGDLGRHVATVSFMKNWTQMDEDRNFIEAFKKLHGPNSWETFLDTRDGTFSNRWDEIWVYNKNMSGQ